MQQNVQLSAGTPGIVPQVPTVPRPADLASVPVPFTVPYPPGHPLAPVEIKVGGTEPTVSPLQVTLVAKPESLEGDNFTTQAKIVTSEKPDIFSDLAALGRTSEELIQAKRILTSLDVRKPKPDEWVRCHERLFTEISLYMPKDSRQAYAVLPEAHDAFGPLIKFVRMTLTVNYTGAVFLWPVPVPTMQKPHQAHVDAHAAAEQASREWVRITWDSKSNSYVVCRRQGGAGKDPEWPEEIADPSAMLRLANKSGALEIIKDSHHPVVQALLGLN